MWPSWLRSSKPSERVELASSSRSCGNRWRAAASISGVHPAGSSNAVNKLVHQPRVCMCLAKRDSPISSRDQSCTPRVARQATLRARRAAKHKHQQQAPLAARARAPPFLPPPPPQSPPAHTVLPNPPPARSWFVGNKRGKARREERCGNAMRRQNKQRNAKTNRNARATQRRTCAGATLQARVSQCTRRILASVARDAPDCPGCHRSGATPASARMLREGADFTRHACAPC